MITHALVQRYPVVICDEHQDSGADQHAIIMELHKAGAQLRVFGDPMQQIFEKGKTRVKKLAAQRWMTLIGNTQAHEFLDKPHRWSKTNRELGEWICHAREILRSGELLDLRRDSPRGLHVVFAEDVSKDPRGYWLAKEDRRSIDAFVNRHDSLLILAAHNETVRSLRALFWRRLPIWEGHNRAATGVFVEKLQNSNGNAGGVAQALIKFMSEVSQGFTLSSYGKPLLRQVESGPPGRQQGKSAILQRLAQAILESPNHKGASRALLQIEGLIRVDPAFKAVKIDLRSEFWEAIRLGEFDDPLEGMAEITRRRARSFISPWRKTISTVHKAKGLECDNVIVIPCDGNHFGKTSRCLLYVAISRAKNSLQLVIPRSDPSPLLLLPPESI